MPVDCNIISRMLPERREFASKSLKGFTTSPNPEVRDLEEVLGIKFTNPPIRVELTRRNGLVLLAREHTIDPFNRGRFNAFYFRHYNAFFTLPGERDRYVAWHENMHGYMDSTSEPEAPALFNALDLVHHRINGEEIDPREMERIASVAAFNEGLADWSAIKTAKEIGNKRELEHAQRKHDIYTGRYDGQYLLDGARLLLKEALSEGKKIIRNPSEISSVMEMKDVLRRITMSTYFVGYSFVLGAMNTLRDRGFSIASAIDYLIANQPTHLKDIENPGGFVNQKLKKV